MRAVRSSGTVMCLASGAAFGAMAIFGKLAYGAGATAGTLLSGRFMLAALVFWLFVPLREVRALALSAAVVYTTYILVSQGVAARVAPQVLSALVCTGAAVSLTVGAALLGQLRPGALSASGWGWLACIALVSTVAAITLFFAGLKRVGPTTASILATVEPVMTVLLAFLVFGERLGALQLVGGALVVSAVPVLHARRRNRTLVPATAPA